MGNQASSLHSIAQPQRFRITALENMDVTKVRKLGKEPVDKTLQETLALQQPPKAKKDIKRDKEKKIEKDGSDIENSDSSLESSDASGSCDETDEDDDLDVPKKLKNLWFESHNVSLYHRDKKTGAVTNPMGKVIGYVGYLVKYTASSVNITMTLKCEFHKGFKCNHGKALTSSWHPDENGAIRWLRDAPKHSPNKHEKVLRNYVCRGRPK